MLERLEIAGHANTHRTKPFEPVADPGWSRIILVLVSVLALGALLALCGSL